MRPYKQKTGQVEFYRVPLEKLVSPDHELVVLAKKIQWGRFDEKFGVIFHRKAGRPGIPTRLMVGLHYLKYTFDLSDYEVVHRWAENPFWQYFCGEEFFTHKLPIDPTSMTRWRKKVGVDGSKEMLLETLSLALDLKALKLTELENLSADTTVQEKNVTFPTDAKLLNRARVKLVTLAKKEGVILRQSYARVGRIALIMQQRYAHAKHIKRAKRQLRKLRTYLGRVIRDIMRKIAGNEAHIEKFYELLNRASALLSEQRYKRGRKIFSMHAPEVECIGKGKAHRPYEFGVKVSLVTTNKSGFIVSCDAYRGRPHDAKTLKPSLSQAEENLGRAIKGGTVAVDLGYRGHKCGSSWHVLHSKLKRLTPRQRKLVRRRSAIEAVISHLKLRCRMGRNFLKGTLGDRMNAIFAAAAFNFRLLIKGVIFFVPEITLFVRTTLRILVFRPFQSVTA